MQFVKTILFFNTLIGTSWTFASKPDCPIDEPDKNIPHEDCSKFYSCSFGKLVENTCPVGLHFHPELDRCESPSEANCQNKPIKPTCENSDRPFVPHETDCSKFYLCLSDGKYELLCRKNWEFNYELQNCAMVTESTCK